MSSRRAKARADTIERIKAASLVQIEEAGAANLSLREVGRQIDLSVAGLYRYYDSRDALLTELIADAFADLALAVSRPADTDEPAPDRLLAAALGYRNWSLRNRHRFMLVFGTPVPGYAAPEGGPTVDAVFSLGIAWGEIVHAGSVEGTIDISTWHGAPLPPSDHPSGRVDATAAEIRAVNSLWAFVHGLVVLEMQHHFSWAIEDAGAFFVGEIHRWLAQLTTGKNK